LTEVQTSSPPLVCINFNDYLSFCLSTNKKCFKSISLNSINKNAKIVTDILKILSEGE